MDLDPYRLPRTVLPTRYRLELQPDLDTGAFEGTVTIDLDVTEATSTVVLNADELEILDVTVNDTPASHVLDSTTERLVITTATPLDPGVASTSVAFRGVLNDKLRGFYRSTFRDDAGELRVIATTQMQPTDCRRAFPCFDEPEFKAVFEIALVIAPDLVAVSNGPEIERSTLEDGRSRVRFAPTMPMSSYLVAFVVGPLEATDPVEVGGVPLRILHVPGKGHLTGFGLDVAAKSLAWFVDYYGIPYPSDKVDLLALPDFAAGAMENLGCITFRENLLLVDPETATQVERQLVADVVAHELAHMWFGDLVTMRWWNGIWLNEAFATFMEVAAVDAYRPAWKRWTSFGLERSAAFEVDALASTRSVEFEVRSPEDSEGMFDVLTYQKGGALLRMLEQYLGPEEFRRGVSHYLERHRYGSTDTNDLWDALEDVTGAPARRIMDSWIWQPGFPLVSARLDGDDLVMSQERLCYSAVGDDGTEPTRWAIPVHVRSDDGTEHRVLLDGEEYRLGLGGGATGPVVVNAGGVGFYRVAYDAVLRSRLSGPALSGLDTLERYHLVDDAWSAVVAGRDSAAGFIEFLDAFTNENDLAVWQAITAGIAGCRRLVEDDALAALAQRVRAVGAGVFERLEDTPSPDEDELTGKLRGLVVTLLAIAGDDLDMRERAQRWWHEDRETPGVVHPELLAAATSIVGATGGRDDWERILDGFRTATTPQSQLRHLYALAESEDETLVRRACELAFSEEVKTQNAPFLLNRCIANRRHGPMAFSIVKDRWQEAVDRFPTNTIVRMVNPVSWLVDDESAATVPDFFVDHPIPQSATTLDQILERQRVNVALRRRESEPLSAWLVAPGS